MDQTITQHLEGFLATARKLETALAEEKRRSQKIAQEYLTTRTTLENAVRELQNRLVQRESRLHSTTDAFQTLQSTENRLKTELREVSEREQKIRAELTQYQSAWNEVLARESQARGAVIELAQAKTTVQEQQNHIRSLETKIIETNQNAATHSRHAETYQRELQSALIRIQSAEAKYSQIQKELAALSQSKRNADEEIARIEISMKERFRWELATEKERLRAELEKDAVLDRERFREVTRAQMKSEIDRLSVAEREARLAAEAELARIQTQITDVEAKRNLELERTRTRVLALTEENNRLQEDLTTIRNEKTDGTTAASERANRAERECTLIRTELAMYQLELSKAHSKAETIKKDANKALLVERIRAEEEVRRMRTQVEGLIERGVYAEKIDEAPAGVRVYTATAITATPPTPITITDRESSRMSPTAE